MSVRDIGEDASSDAETPEPVVVVVVVSSVVVVVVVVVVSVVVVVVVVCDEHIMFNFAREPAPTNPVPAVSPTGARTSDAYLFWNLTTAALVRPPKYLVSFPIDPTPDADT
jgi:hypothetical protein